MQLQRKYIILLILVIACLAIFFWPKDDSTRQVVLVQKGHFKTSITETGELKAAKAENILAPHATIKDGNFLPGMDIIDLVPEGTMVKKGDRVATLDPKNVINMLNNIDMQTMTIQQRIEQSKLDSSFSLNQARNSIQAIREQVGDAKLKVDQSIYESKSVQRQAQLDLEKTQRKLNSELRNYDQKQRSLKAQLERETKYLNNYMAEVNGIQLLLSQTVVLAPTEGMVIYADRFGMKTQVGSTVNNWQSVIATLPDLRYIKSVVMVKETDIAKIKVGQTVDIKIEALPGKTFNGIVKKIANIGKQVVNQPQIVFEVSIDVSVPNAEPPFELMPNMTSTNVITTGEWDNTLFIDKRCVHANDSITYVWKRKGTSFKQHSITIGAENKEFIQILDGLEEGDKVLLN